MLRTIAISNYRSLGRLIAQSSQRTQIFVVTHAAALIAALREQPKCNSLVLEKSLARRG
jgi:predicted ATPase